MHKFDAGDTAWLLVCTALVLLMTPGLALFYGSLNKKSRPRKHAFIQPAQL